MRCSPENIGDLETGDSISPSFDVTRNPSLDVSGHDGVDAGDISAWEDLWISR